MLPPAVFVSRSFGPDVVAGVLGLLATELLGHSPNVSAAVIGDLGAVATQLLCDRANVHDFLPPTRLVQVTRHSISQTAAQARQH